MTLFSGCSFSSESDCVEHNSSPYVQQKNISTRILSMLISRDSDGLYNMFSLYKRETTDISAQIEELFKNYDFSEYDIERANYNCVNGEQSIRDGRIVYLTLSDNIKKIYDNEGIEYRISYYYIITDCDEPEKEGLVGITIIRVNDKSRFDVD